MKGMAVLQSQPGLCQPQNLLLKLQWVGTGFPLGEQL